MSWTFRAAHLYMALPAALVIVTGCSQSGPTPSASNPVSSGSVVTRTISPAVDHIHGVGFDAPANRVLLGTHTGIWQLQADGSNLARAAAPPDDYMGFTVVGRGRYLSSGHPGADSDQPNPLGLIESKNLTRWRTLSLTGETDFHALAARGDNVVGFDTSRGLRISQDGGRSWAPGAQEPVISLAYAGDTLFATTRGGLAASRDDGATLELVAHAPDAAFLAGTDSGGLWVVGPDGRVSFASDGATFTPVATTNVAPEAITAVDDTKLLVVTADSITTVTRRERR